MRIALIAAIAVAFAVPAFAQAASQDAKPATEAKATKKGGLDDPNRIVCKREHVVGSNRPEKICMTVAERNRLKDQADLITDPGRAGAGNKNEIATGNSGM